MRIYSLVIGPNGKPSNQSKYYAVVSKHIWHVVAKSVKQAYFLAANDIWRQDGKGTGIVETANNQLSGLWLRDDGEKTIMPRYKHGQKLSS